MKIINEIKEEKAPNGVVCVGDVWKNSGTDFTVVAIVGDIIIYAWDDDGEPMFSDQYACDWPKNSKLVKRQRIQ